MITLDKNHRDNNDNENCLPTMVRVNFELLIYSGKLAPSEVTDILEICPTYSTEAGGESEPNSLGKVRVYKKNIWSFSSESKIESLDFDEHFIFFNDIFEKKLDKLELLQNMLDVIMCVRCIFWKKESGGGPVFSSFQLEKLALFRTTVELDVQEYP